MAFDRRLEILVGNVATTFLAPPAVDISGLDCSFKVQRAIGGSEGTAEVTIYNAKEATRARLQEGTTLTIRAGYADDTIGTIFIGMITQAGSQPSGSDWVSAIKASTFNHSVMQIPLSISYSPRVSFEKVLRDLTTQIGMVLTGGENVSGVLLPNGWVFVGNPYEAIVYCRQIAESNGYRLFVDNNEIVVYRIKFGTTYTAAYLDHTCGLISCRDESQPFRKGEDAQRKRVSFLSLLNWKIRPNSLVTIDSSKNLKGETIELVPRVKGIFLVEKVDFHGDNFGGAFNVSGEASL